MKKTTIGCRRLLTPQRLIAPATLEIQDGLVASISDGVSNVDRLLDGTVVPGYVDLQVNGFGDADLTTGGLSAVEATSVGLLSAGVTGFLATVVSCPEPDRLAALDAVAKSASPGARVLGVHLEGPWLAPSCRGAHLEQHLSVPNPEVVERSLQRHPRLVRLMTIAPEVHGALDAIRIAVESGAVVSLGHSAADIVQTQMAIAAGARMATHAPNAMGAWHHRRPGIFGAVLDDALVTLGVIADGRHLHDATLRLLFRAKGFEQIVLVSDLVAATSPMLENKTLAGGSIGLGQCVAHAVSAWVPLEEAVAVAGANPARLLGEQLGKLEPGRRADFVQLDDHNLPASTFIGGREVWRA